MSELRPAEILERSQWDTFWLPEDAVVIDRPEYLQVTCPRPALYLNSVLRVRLAPGRAAPWIEEISAAFAPGMGRVMITDTWDSAPLVAALDAAGWTRGAEHEVRVMAIDRWVAGRRAEVRRVDDLATLKDAVRASAEAFGRPDTSTPEELEADLRTCTAGARVRRFVAYDAGEPVGSGGLTAFPDLGFGLLWAGCVVERARGRGVYRALLDARVAEARRMGLRQVGLYAQVDTSGPIVARLGFERQGTMTFWDRPC